MDNTSKEDLVYEVFERISTGYDSANNRISLGLHRSWKRMLTDRLVNCLPLGAEMLDVCCGTGDIALETAERRRDLRLIGLDFSPSMLTAAEARRGGIENVRFTQGDAMALPFENDRFAAACISFGLRNTADYGQVLREMSRVVRPGGYVCCLDSFVPDHRFVQPFYRFYFRTIMPRVGGGRKHTRDYQWLYESTEQFLRSGELKGLFQTVGLREVRAKSRMCGACVLVWGQKEAAAAENLCWNN